MKALPIVTLYAQDMTLLFVILVATLIATVWRSVGFAGFLNFSLLLFLLLADFLSKFPFR